MRRSCFSIFPSAVSGPDVGEVSLAFVFNRDGVDRRIFVIILAQGIAFPVEIEEEAAHIGVVDEDDPEEVVDLAFIDGRDGPEIENRMDQRTLTVAGSHDLYGEVSVEFCGSEVIDTAHTVFLPVHTHDCHKEIK